MQDTKQLAITGILLAVVAMTLAVADQVFAKDHAHIQQTAAAYGRTHQLSICGMWMDSKAAMECVSTLAACATRGRNERARSSISIGDLRSSQCRRYRWEGLRQLCGRAERRQVVIKGPPVLRFLAALAPDSVFRQDVRHTAPIPPFRTTGNLWQTDMLRQIGRTLSDHISGWVRHWIRGLPALP